MSSPVFCVPAYIKLSILSLEVPIINWWFFGYTITPSKNLPNGGGCDDEALNSTVVPSGLNPKPVSLGKYVWFVKCLLAVNPPAASNDPSKSVSKLPVELGSEPDTV